MKLNILRNILVSIIITKFVKATYIFEAPSPKENKCFEVGTNSNDFPRCIQFKGYFLPQTDRYSDYTSFSSFVSSVVLNDDTLNRLYLEPVGCSANASSIDLKEEMFCSYVLYDVITNNRCSDNRSLPEPSNFICTSKCLNYMKQLKAICPANTYSNSGVTVLEGICGDLKNCGDTPKISNALTETINNTNEVSPVDTNSNVVNNSTVTGNINNSVINTNITDVNNLNTANNVSNGGTIQNGGNGNGGTNSNNNTIRTNNDNGKSTSTNGDGKGVDKNILYTIGFMVPISIFVGFGLMIYHNKQSTKIYKLEKELYSSQFSSKHSYNNNHVSRNSVSSNGNGSGNHQKNVAITLPLSNKNIEEQDNMATNRVAELISTATMINAANHANNNIQPITPNEVNINVNTRYNTLNSHRNSINSANPLNKSNSVKTNLKSNNNNNNNNNNDSNNRKLPSFVINKTQDSNNNNNNNINNNNISLNVNVNPTSSLKPTLQTQINPLSPTTPDSEASPIIDLSISSEHDPLLHIKKSNSFYHSSVSSESKKYNSFISPVSPIISEKSLMDNTNDGKEKRKSYTNHLLTQSILVANGDNEEEEEEENERKDKIKENDNENENHLESIDNDENIPLEEENTELRPSKIFSTDISVINNTEDYSSTRYNNGISITIDDADNSCRSSKYSSAKIPLSVMTVVQEFEPRMDDELALQMNDRILLLKIFDDGWAVGLNQMTGKQGVFPMEYVVSSELIASNNKFASQIEYRNVLPSRVQSQAFSNLSFSNTTINDSVIHLTISDFDINSFSKSQSMASSKYYNKSLVVDGSKKDKLNNNSVIED